MVRRINLLTSATVESHFRPSPIQSDWILKIYRTSPITVYSVQIVIIECVYTLVQTRSYAEIYKWINAATKVNKNGPKDKSSSRGPLLSDLKIILFFKRDHYECLNASKGGGIICVFKLCYRKKKTTISDTFLSIECIVIYSPSIQLFYTHIFS